MRSYRHLPVFLAVIVTLIIVGCSGKSGSKQLGVAAPSDVPRVTLKQVTSEPAAFDGKNVVMEGIVSGQCASLCEFTYKEGTDAVVIFPQGFKLPKLQTGSKVRMHAQISKGEERVVISALGLEQL